VRWAVQGHALWDQGEHHFGVPKGGKSRKRIGWGAPTSGMWMKASVKVRLMRQVTLRCSPKAALIHKGRQPAHLRVAACPNVIKNSLVILLG